METWHIDSKSAVLESDEVPPEKEDDPDAGVPEFAIKNQLRPALCVTDTQGVVINAKAQLPNVSDEQLFEAFMFYFEHDAFIEFRCRGPVGYSE